MEELEKKRKKSLRKKSRDPRVPFEETSFDRELLALLVEFRLLTAKWIVALTGQGYQRVARRMKPMFHNGYIGRRWIEKEPIYFLEKKGIETIALYVTGEVTAGDPTHFIHDLSIAHFHVCVALALRDIPDSELEVMHGRKLYYRTDKGLRHIKPDDGLIIRVGDNEWLHLFEYNRRLRLPHFSGR